MKLVTLMENTGPEGLTAEHGLSLYLETEHTKILFDTGATGAFADNAEILGVDLSQVDLAVLSHGHYDHGGGLRRFLELNAKAKVYVNCHAFEPHYNGAGKDIGLDPGLAKDPRLVFVEGDFRLSDKLSLHTLSGPPEDTAGLTVLEQGTQKAEDFRHEQYLLIREGKKRILISGCSHKGIRTIAAHFRPDVLIGGFHFMKIEDAAFLEAAAKELLEKDTIYYTGHCTGQTQYGVLKGVMADRLHCLTTGTVAEV